MHLIRAPTPGSGKELLADTIALIEGEWLLTDLARHLRMPSATLHRWRKVGWVHSRKLPVAGGHWALWADAAELKRLARLRGHQRPRRDQPIPSELTTPKKRKQK